MKPLRIDLPAGVKPAPGSCGLITETCKLKVDCSHMSVISREPRLYKRVCPLVGRSVSRRAETRRRAAFVMYMHLLIQ